MNNNCVSKLASQAFANLVSILASISLCLGTFAQPPTQPASWRNDALTKRMSQETNQWDMLQVDGLPIVGNPWVLQDAMQDTQGITPMSFTRQSNRLAERILVTYLPALTDPDQDPNQLKPLLPVYEGLLGQSVMSRYVNLNHSDWKGEDEFARRESLTRFHNEQAESLKSAAFSPPYRVRTIRRVSVENYDFDNERFQLTSGEFKTPQSVFLRLKHRALGSTKVDLANQLKVAFPFYWPMPTDQARVVSKRLQSGNHRNSRYAYISSIFDIVDKAHTPGESSPAISQVSSIKELDNQWLSIHVESSLYADPFLKSHLWRMPISGPKPSFLQRSDFSPSQTTPTTDPCPLWQRDVMTAAIDAAHPGQATREDWALAAIVNWKRDYAYYAKQHAWSDCLNDKTRRELSRMSLQDTHPSVYPQLHDVAYQPFFSNGQFPSRSVALDSMLMELSDSKLSKLRDYARRKVRRCNGLFCLPVLIGVNESERQGKIIHSEFSQWGTSDAKDFQNQTNVGLVVKAQTLSRGHEPEFGDAANRPHFAFSYPAVSQKLLFKVDPTSIPSDVPPADQEGPWKIYPGRLIVKVTGVKDGAVLNSNDNLKYHIINISPVRFENHNQAKSDEVTADELDAIGQITFQLPLEISPYSLSEQLAAQEEINAKAKKMIREKRKRESDEIQEQIRREKAEKDRRWRERMKEM